MTTGRTESKTAELFLQFSRKRLLETDWPRLKGCVESLSDEQIWWRPNESSNSVGNLLLHLNGNVRQWLVSSFRRLEDARNRPVEFSTRGTVSGRDLLARVDETLREAGDVLNSLTQAELCAEYEIQGYRVTGLDAIYQVVAHFGLHYGQVLYITKMLRNEDLGFFRDLSATGRKPPESKVSH